MKTASMRASTLRVFLTALSLAVGLVLLAALATAYAGNTAAPDSPPDPNRVDVVVDLGNGNVLTRRVTFTEPTLNGLQVLQRSGLNLEIVTYSFGAAVCSIEGVGCPATNCFCNPDKFWGYLYWEDGWQGYPTGPSGSTVANGGVGYACIAELRMYETIEGGRPVTPFMRFGDRVRMEMLDANGASIFGAIDQVVERCPASP